MSEKNGLDLLNQEIEIPDTVDRKAMEAFSRIRREASGTAKERQERADDGGRNIRTVGRRNWGRRTVVTILAAVMVLGTLTVALASYSRLSAGLKEFLGITDRQEQEMIEKNDPILDLVEERNTAVQAEETSAENAAEVISATDQGITVTVEQTVADNFVIMLACRIEGLESDSETGNLPYFYPDLLLDGKDVHKSADMHSVLREDGSVEYDIVYRLKLYKEDALKPGEFFGKEISLLIDRVYTGKDYTEEEGDEGRYIDGNWNLSWTLGGAEDIRVETLDEVLGDTGAAVKEVQVSPLSLTVIYEFPEEIFTETTNEGNEAHISTDPPLPCGIIMEDGTEYTSAEIFGGSSICRSQDNPDRVFVVYALKTILDPDQVAGVLVHDITGASGATNMGDIFRVMFEE